jgi:hypothetical protein
METRNRKEEQVTMRATCHESSSIVNSRRKNCKDGEDRA